MNTKLSQNDIKELKKFSGYEHSCAICGRGFICGGEYIYKRRATKDSASVYFCSWSCFRKDEMERNKKTEKNRAGVMK